MFVLTIHQDSPNTLNGGYPQQANQNQGRGFFSAPSRGTTGGLVRGLSSSFDDHWSQPRLFYNSLTAVEQQFLINAIRFETSNLKSTDVKQNVLGQLNRISHDIAVRVASAIGLEAPAPDDTYYHDNTTAGISITNETLPSVTAFKVGILATLTSNNSANALDSATTDLAAALTAAGLTPIIVAERLTPDGAVGKTYSATDATDFDALVITSSASGAGLFSSTPTLSPLYPPQRPLLVASASFLFGKPLAYLGSDAPAEALVVGAGLDPETQEGVYASADVEKLTQDLVAGLKTFKFTGRYPVDPSS